MPAKPARRSGGLKNRRRRGKAGVLWSGPLSPEGHGPRGTGTPRVPPAAPSPQENEA
jgi:hypothetical protein